MLKQIVNVFISHYYFKRGIDGIIAVIFPIYEVVAWTIFVSLNRYNEYVLYVIILKYECVL